jgi:hypothetical protein
MSRMPFRRFVLVCRESIPTLLAGAGFFAVLAGNPQTSTAAEPPVAIEIAASPITAFDIAHPLRRQFGLLEFRGGLVLHSPYQHFDCIF